MITSGKGVLIAAAVAGLFGACASKGGADNQPSTSGAMGGTIQCAGINSCKGQGSCAGNENACKAQNSCKGKGHVETTKADCMAKGGTVLASKM
jgi:hypothetical protein